MRKPSYIRSVGVYSEGLLREEGVSRHVPAIWERFLSSDSVLIHGEEWKWADVADAVEYCARNEWRRSEWKRRAALVPKRGDSIRLYRGQKFDPAKFDLVPNGWSHDHCEICWWDLFETDDPERGIGYVSQDGRWVCRECYEQFLQSRVRS